MAMGKKACIIVTLMLLPLAMISVINAQNIPKPSVPVSALASLADVTTAQGATTTDSTTGATSTELVVNGIKISVINQPFSYSFNGTTYVLCYDYRYKAHSAQNWEKSPYTQNNSYPLQSNSGTTWLLVEEISIPQPADDAQIDFQVQAIAGHYHQTESGTFIFPDQTSGWTPTHTVTISYPTQTVTGPRPTMHTDSPPPSPSPTIPELPVGIVLPFLTVTGLLVYLASTNHRNWKKTI
jgi:hypothetical protein